MLVSVAAQAKRPMYFLTSCAKNTGPQPPSPQSKGKMELEISHLAQLDLEEIADYIAQDSPANADRFVESLQMQCRKLVRAPFAYVARPEVGDGFRSCAHGRYTIFFRVDGKRVFIVRILHSARDVIHEVALRDQHSGGEIH